MKRYLLPAVWLLTTAAAISVYLFQLVWLVQYFQNLPPGLLRALDLSGVSFGAFVLFNALNHAGLFFPFFIAAQLIFLRRGRERFPVVAAFALLSLGIVVAAPALPEFYAFVINPPLYYQIPTGFLVLVFATSLPVFLVTYPDGTFVPRVGGVVTVALGLFLAAMFLTPSIFWGGEAAVTISAGVICTVLFGSVVYIQVWRYRNYLQPLQKQQVKWFLFGVVTLPLGFLPWILFSQAWVTPDEIAPTYIPLLSFMLVWSLIVVALPISIGIAILKYRLWEIDVLLRRTVTYALLTGTLLLIFFGSVIVLQQILASITGASRGELVTVLSTLAIAALFVPLRNRIQNAIDRRFNRSKYDAQQVMSMFATTVRDETDLEQLSGKLIQVVDETMQPASVSIWVKGLSPRGKMIDGKNEG